jgi:hypothetical protein
MEYPVEIEFSVNLSSAKEGKPEFALLQIRPMTARTEHLKVDIRDRKIARVYYSDNALYLAHIHLDKPFTLKMDGRKSRCMMFAE